MPAAGVDFGIFRGIGPGPLFATFPFSPARGEVEGGETSGEDGEVAVGGIAGFQQVGSGGLEWSVSEEVERVVAKERTSERGAEA